MAMLKLHSFKNFWNFLEGSGGWGRTSRLFPTCHIDGLRLLALDKIRCQSKLITICMVTTSLSIFIFGEIFLLLSWRWLGSFFMLAGPSFSFSLTGTSLSLIIEVLVEDWNISEFFANCMLSFLWRCRLSHDVNVFMRISFLPFLIAFNVVCSRSFIG